MRASSRILICAAALAAAMPPPARAQDRADVQIDNSILEALDPGKASDRPVARSAPSERNLT